MITRIVRMVFHPDKVDDFLGTFSASKQLIRNFPGVHHLELHRDASQRNVFYTYSKWENQEALEAYRHSELFKGIWAKTRVLFADKPKAYSLKLEVNVEA